MKRKLTAIFLCLAMALTLLPTAALADTLSGKDLDSEENCTHAVAKVSDAGNSDEIVAHFDTIADAVDKGQMETPPTFKLLRDVKENVVIPAGKDIYLDLNGHKLTNVDGNTITVEQGGQLTITDSVGTGVVDNVTHQKAAVKVNVGGEVTINGGTYSRSAEASTGAEDSGNNSYYVIDNQGSLEITAGTFKFSDTNSGAFSSLIHNGWYNGAENTEKAPAVMTIKGGEFTQGTGGKITVKNDDYGDLTIQGGTFTQPETKYYCVYNFNKAKIEGGTINGHVGNSAGSDTSMDAGELTITGGTITGDVDVAEGSTASVTGGTFADIASAVKYAADGAEIKLAEDVAADVVIPAGKTITLDLNGHKLTNVKDHTITNYGNLTVTGTGTVDNITNGKGALVNKVGATATLNGGTFTRSQEAGTYEPNAANGNSWYTVKNYGTMVINEGTTVTTRLNDGEKAVGGHSSLIANGWQNNDDRTANPKGEATAAKLTINGGTFIGGINTVKNDDDGELIFNDGECINYTQAAFQNHHIAAINGGTFTAESRFAVYNCPCDATMDKGELTITDGSFTGEVYNEKAAFGFIKIEKGYFTEDPSNFVDTATHSVVAATKAGYTYEVIEGTSTTPDQKIFVVDKTETEEVSEDAGINEADATAINNVIAKTNVDGVAEAVAADQKKAIVTASGVTPDEGDKVEIEVQVKVAATAADLTKNTLTYEITPVAVVKVNGQVQGSEVALSNSYLNGKGITVRLPLPEGFDLKQIKHQITNGGTEYFLAKEVRGAKVFTLKEDNTVEFTVTGFSTFTLSGEQTYVAPSGGSGGGSSVDPSYTVSVPSVKNGTVTVNPTTAKAGATVTVTVKPADGYQLSTIQVLDKDGKEVKLTDKGDGKYTFTMPASKVDVKAAFAEAAQSTGFADVPSDAYCAEAVKWAVANGVTKGLTETRFGMNEPCTRGQIVTFLWRAAGSPAPAGTAAVPADVAPGSYCYDAVAWALEKGITKGFADGTFGANLPCTRAQSVTFLYRAMGKAPSTAAAFSDVPAGAFYTEAVAWAVENGVTKGTTDTTFSPDATCTRGQIVTFLYRANQSK